MSTISREAVAGRLHRPSSEALQWGIEHESVAIQAYELEMGTTVFTCKFFVCTDQPFFGASSNVVFGK